MASRQTSRFIQPAIYAAGAGIIGGSVLYFKYRPRNIPGSEAALVPPPTYGDGGNFRLPTFPRVWSRAEQIAALKASFAGNGDQNGPGRSGVIDTLSSLWGGKKSNGTQAAVDEDGPSGTQEYDLLVIGGGATGTGIALDAATRGLKVALVEREDFSAGTSSKSTKLVHGGVRYLEKAVWELDYEQ
jgi:glycerol-3-phosphate dehydrogenase